MKKLLTLITAITLLFILLGCTQSSVCGNGLCEQNETPENCPIQTGGDCPPTCESGACTPQDITDDQKNTLTVYTCKDTDGGIKYNTQGTITFTNATGTKTRTDFCLDNNHLREWYCTTINGNNLRKYDDHLCANECTNGRCLGTTGNLKIVAPQNGIYLGAYNWLENGEKPGVKEFEDAIGKKVAIVGVQCISPETQKFKINVSCLNELYSKGYVTSIDITARDPTNKNFTAQDIINGEADYVLEEIANDLITFNKPIFFNYLREPSFMCGFYSGSWDTREFSCGYGPNGDMTAEEAGNFWGQYTSPNGDDCNSPTDLICDDGRERYRDMTRHIHDKIESIAPGRATWVMGAVIDRKPGAYASWYPGNQYVDWLALDVYPWYGTTLESLLFKNTVEPDWSEALELAPGKPVILTEFGLHILLGFGTNDYNRTKVSKPVWFRDFFQTAKTTHPQLGAFIYWQMGADAFDNSNTRIRVGDPAAQTWRKELANDTNFWVSNIITAGGAIITGPGGGIPVPNNEKTPEAEENPTDGMASGVDGACYTTCRAEGNTIDYCNSNC